MFSSRLIILQVDNRIVSYFFPVLPTHVGQHESEELLNLGCGISVLSPDNKSVSEMIRVLDGDQLSQLEVGHHKILLSEVIEAVKLLFLMPPDASI